MAEDQYQYVKLPSGEYGKFAANASDDDIRARIQKDFPDAFKTQQPSAPEPGFLQSVGQGLKNFGHMVTHPVEAAESMGEQQVAGGRTPYGAPIFSPTGNRVIDEQNESTIQSARNDMAQQGKEMAAHPSASAGEFIGQSLPLLALGGAAGGMKMLPTRAGAGALFEDVMSAAKDQPVNLTRSLQPLERIQQLTSRGGPTVGAADKLYNRINTTNPLSYEEARDFYSNLSGLSANDKMSLNPTMKRELGNFTGAFKEDIGDTAASAGKGEEYNKAMRDYARASQLKDLRERAMKYAIPALLGAGGATVVGSALRDLLLK